MQSPQVLYVDIAMTLTVGAGSTTAALTAQLETLVAGYVNGLSVGAPLALSRLTVLAYNLSPYVSNVTGVSANGGAADVIPAASQVVKLRSCTVS